MLQIIYPRHALLDCNHDWRHMQRVAKQPLCNGSASWFPMSKTIGRFGGNEAAVVLCEAPSKSGFCIFELNWTSVKLILSMPIHSSGFFIHQIDGFFRSSFTLASPQLASKNHKNATCSFHQTPIQNTKSQKTPQTKLSQSQP